MSMTAIDTVKCEVDGCGVRIRRDVGSVFCLKHQEEYEQVVFRLEATRLAETLRNRAYGVGEFATPPPLCADALAWINRRGAVAMRDARLEAESATAPVAADAERRSGLLATLPRVQAGLTPMHADAVCEASDFPSLLADASWREKALLVSEVLLVGGAAAVALVLLGMGAKVALGWLLARSA